MAGNNEEYHSVVEHIILSVFHLTSLFLKVCSDIARGENCLTIEIYELIRITGTMK